MQAQPTQHAIAAMRARIELSGTLRAEIGGRDVAARLPGRQGRALFAYLVVNRHRPVSRGELIGVLWPHVPPVAPEAGLSTVLARSRRALGEGVVQGRAELQIVLDRDTDVDIERAEAAARGRGATARRRGRSRRAAAAEAALEIVGRPLLPGIEGDWVESRRVELAALEPGLLEVLARAALVIGDREHLAIAERVARTLAERHPFRESGHALLIEVHGRRGNVAEATLAYDRLRVFLRDELGTVPSGAVSALHEAAAARRRPGRDRGARPPRQRAHRRGPRPPARRLPLPFIGAMPAATPFVGREEQLEALRVPWLEAGTGQRRLALLVGEAGIGKTRLAAQFAAERARRRRHRPLRALRRGAAALLPAVHRGAAPRAAPRRAAGRSRRGARPRGARPDPARGAARAGAGAAAPAQDAETERYRLFEAVASLLRRATERGAAAARHRRPALGRQADAAASAPPPAPHRPRAPDGARPRPRRRGRRRPPADRADRGPAPRAALATASCSTA